MSRPWRRIRVLLPAVLVVLAGLALLLLHTEWARERVLRIALSRAAPDGSITASALDYNLLTLRFDLEELELRSPGDPRPYFTATSLRVDVPWSALWRPWLQEVTLVAPRLSVVVDDDGASNFTGGGTRVEFPLPIERLELRGLRLAYDDARYDASFSADRLDVAIAAAADDSWLRQGQPAVLRRGAASEEIRVRSGSLGWDGLAALMRGLELQSAPLDLAVDGRIDEALAGRDFDLRSRAALRLDALAGLAPEAAPLDGEIAVEARIAGDGVAPTAELSASAPTLRRGRLAVDDLVAAVRWDGGLSIDRLDGRVAGGEFALTGRLGLASSRSELNAAWTEIGVEPLLADLRDAEPVAEPATRATGSLRVGWDEALPTASSVSARLDARLGRIGRAGVEGTVVGSVDGARARFDVDLAADNGAGSLRASADAGLLDEAPWVRDIAGRVDATLRFEGLPVYLPAAADAAGTLSLAGELGGDLDRPQVEASIEVAAFRYADFPAADATARLRLQGSGWSLERVVATLPGTHAEASLAGTFDLGELGGRASVAITDPGALVASLPTRMTSGAAAPPLAGLIDLDLDIVARGDGTNPHTLLDGLEAELTGKVAGLLIDGVGPVEGEGTASLGGTRWSVERLALRGPGGHLALTSAGTLDLQTLDGSAEIAIESIGDLVSLWPAAARPEAMPALAGRGTAQIAFSGGIDGMRLGGGVEVADLRIDARGPISLRTHFEPTDFGTRITDLEIVSPRSEITASGVVGPAANTVDLVARARVGDLAGLSGLEWLDSIRRLDAEAAIGMDRDAGLLTVDLWSLDVELPALTLRSELPGRVAWGPDGLSIEDLRLVSGTTELTAAGVLPASDRSGSLRTLLRGDLGDLDDLVAILWERGGLGESPSPRAAGAFSVELGLDGNLEELLVSGGARVADATISWGELEPVEEIGLDLTVDGDGLHLRSAEASWRGARARGALDLPLAHLPGLAELFPDARGHDSTATLELRSATPALLAGFVPEDLLAAVGGELDAVLALTADRPELAAVEGELRLEALRLWSDDVELQQTRPTRIGVRGRHLEILDWDWRSPGAIPWTLRAGGSIDLEPGAPLESALALRLESDLDLATVNGLVSIAALGGRLRVAADVGGTPGNPEARGSVALDQVRVAVRDPRLQITGLQGTLDLQGTRVSTDGITGSANGGDLMLFASLDLARPLAPVGLAGITGRGVALQAAAGVRADTDIDLSLSARGEEGMTLLGTITLLEGGYRSTAPLSPSSFGDLTSTAPPGEPSGFLDSIRYDIRVRSADDLIVDTRYADLSLALDLQVVGAGDRPGVLGQARLNEGGEIRLSGNTLVIDRGFIDFADGSRIAPTLDIEASSRVRSYEVTIRLLGDAFSPTLEAEASGGLSEADALSLLATGRTLEEAGSSGTEILAEQAFNVVAGRVEGLARGVGVSSVRFQQAESEDNWRSLAEPDLFPRTTDLSARLSITRSFGESFDLVYSQGLTRSDEQSWIGVLRLPWNLGLNAGVYDDGTSALELHHGLEFGRAGNDPAALRSAPAVRIEAITFAGDTGRPEAELRRTLSLEPGDRFDYLSWRRDVERLTRSYHEAGYFEADVQPSRRAAGTVDADTGRPSRIVLHYEIERGPRTELVVDGFSPDSRTRERLEQHWQNAVADSFLLEDLAREARRALLDRGHARPLAEAVFELDTDEERRIRLRVTPGPRFDRVQTEVVGSVILDRAEIDARLDQLGLHRAAWWDPSAVADAITALYRERGFRETVVEIDEPVFGPKSASIRVLIREGAPRRLGAVHVRGNEVLDEASVLRALPAAPGGILTRAWLDQAAIAIDAAYLRLAYNDVQIATSTAESNGAVDVRFEIREGPRRVLESVEVVGRHRTRRAVIDRAIGMKPGDPLVLADVQAVRRRLLATDAIQSASVQIRDAGPVANGVRPGRLVVTIVELPLLDVRYGVQLLSETLDDARETTPGIGASVAHQNFLGVGGRVSMVARYRAQEPFGRFAVSFPRFFGAPIRTTLVAQGLRDIIDLPFGNTLRRDEQRLLLEQRLQLNRLTIGYSYAWERNLNQILGSDTPLHPGYFTSLIPTFIWDSRDNGFAPRAGLFHSSTVKLSLSTLGSDQEFYTYYGQQFLFVPLGPVVFATAVRFGTGKSLDPKERRLPEDELFTAGGGTTVRGYPDAALGFTAFPGGPYPGGNAVLILNQEVRFPVWGWIEGVAFADAGSAFSAVGEIDLASLAYSVGAGLRLVSPYVTLRLDYGFRLTDVYGLEPATGRLHFGIGHIF